MGQINYGGYPSVDVLFDQNAALVDPASPARVAAACAAQNVTDLFVVSHGWNNDIPEAIALYSALFDRVRAQSTNAALAGIAGRTFAILAVFWPSKRFTDAATIPGGAAGAQDARDAAIAAGLDNLADVFAARGMSAELAQAKALIGNLDDDATAQDRFVAILHDVLDPKPEPDAGLDQLRSGLEAAPGRDVLESLQGASLGTPAPVAGSDSGGAADLSDAGGAADFGNIFATIKDAALGLLNVTTYSTMKDRAGLVGRTGLAPVLDAHRAAAPAIKLHLAGHSFGARLVTAATQNAAAPADTLALLQGAFSHYGFAANYDGANNDGFFRDVVAKRRVTGPIIATHSVHDLAVGLAYPIVSRILDQAAASVGDQNDPFGGLGRNGAQKTPEVPNVDAVLQTAGGTYAFAPSVPNNLCGDAFIQSHGDIARDEVAYAMLTAIGQT